MKLPALFNKSKKLEATARRAAPAIPRDSDEPSMNLSTAVLVVLILHIVAIGGIYAFSSIKAHRGPASFEAVDKKEAAAVAPKVVKDPAPAPAKAQHTEAPAAPAKTTETAAKKPVATPAKTSLRDSGNTYLVVKGDKLATIAKKLHVNPDDLMKLNKIDDPKKLQIGQKLRIPAKRPGSEA